MHSQSDRFSRSRKEPLNLCLRLYLARYAVALSTASNSE